MDYAHALLAFTGIAVLLTVTPGLDMALVLRSALSHGPRHAATTGLGICSGSFVWGLAAAVGVAALLAASELAYTALKVVGAVYLVWLGVGMLRASFRRPPVPQDAAGAGAADPAAPAVPAARGERLSRGFVRGFTTNMLNPKVGVFYVAMIPQFMAPGVPAWLMGLSLAGVHVVLTLVFFTLLISAAQAFRRFPASPRATAWVDRVTGTALVGFGAALAVPSR